MHAGEGGIWGYDINEWGVQYHQGRGVRHRIITKSAKIQESASLREISLSVSLVANIKASIIQLETSVICPNNAFLNELITSQMASINDLWTEMKTFIVGNVGINDEFLYLQVNVISEFPST